MKNYTLKTMKNFKFKLSEELYYDFFDQNPVDKDTIYSAVQSTQNEDQYMVYWLDPETNSIESVDYKKSTIEEALNEGSWILVEETETH